MNKKNFSYKKLHKKWSDLHKAQQALIIEKHKDALDHISKNTKQYALGAVSGFLLLTSPATATHTPGETVQYEKVNKNVFLVSDLAPLLPTDFRYLTDDENELILTKLREYYNMSLDYEIDGLRLNTTYGLMGAEQTVFGR